MEFKVFHASKKMTEKLPVLDSVLKNNPELLAKLQSTVNNSISKSGEEKKVSQAEKNKHMYDQMQKIKEQKKKYEELQRKQQEIFANIGMSSSHGVRFYTN